MNGVLIDLDDEWSIPYLDREPDHEADMVYDGRIRPRWFCLRRWVLDDGLWFPEPLAVIDVGNDFSWSPNGVAAACKYVHPDLVHGARSEWLSLGCPRLFHFPVFSLLNRRSSRKPREKRPGVVEQVLGQVMAVLGQDPNRDPWTLTEEAEQHHREQ